MNQFLYINNLQKKVSDNCIVDINSLEIQKGEIFSILGPSGSGKTSLLRMIGGFEMPSNGSIHLLSNDITNLSPEKRKINTVFQNYALFPHLSVRENIAFGLKMKGLTSKEIYVTVDKMISLVRMNNFADKMPSQLSGGQKQRTAIARALVMKPQVLLLDEPLSALDLKLKQCMLLELDQIHDEVGITFVFVTHDQSEAMGISDRMAIMNNGRIEQVGTPIEIYEAPNSKFVAEFIGDTNIFSGNVIGTTSDNDYLCIDVEGLCQIYCYKDKEIPIGSSIDLSIRPEKFYISLEPTTKNGLINVLQGVVDDIIYFGSQTKYWINVGDKHRVAVFRQNNHFLLDEHQISWKDKVWLTWSADDGYMIDNQKQ